MAGRPRKMAQKVSDLEEKAAYLSIEVLQTIPKQYRQNPNARDPLNQAWNNAYDATLLCSIELERLGDLLRSKAGIEGPGPSALIFTRDNQSPIEP